MFQPHDGDLHLTGIDKRNGDGRISEVIDAFDSRTLVRVSSSGGLYCLTGGPGWYPDADCVWQVWLPACEIP